MSAMAQPEVAVPTLKELKLLLVEREMTVTDLARELGVHRYSIYRAISTDISPGVSRRLAEWYAAALESPVGSRASRRR